jgi:sulfur transfer complex TusBCD TusB component (DsrH family)
MILHTFSHLAPLVLELVISSLSQDDLIVLLVASPNPELSLHRQVRLLVGTENDSRSSQDPNAISMDCFIELTNQAQQVVNW